MDNNDLNNNNQTQSVTHETQTVQKHKEQLGARSIVAACFGLIEILIAMRFALKLFGANINNGFVIFMNNLTGFFVNLFKGIFVERAFGNGYAVFEPASIVALIVVALVAWFVLRLMTRNNNKRTEQTSVTAGTTKDKMN